MEQKGRRNNYTAGQDQVWSLNDDATGERNMPECTDARLDIYKLRWMVMRAAWITGRGTGRGKGRMNDKPWIQVARYIREGDTQYIQQIVGGGFLLP